MSIFALRKSAVNEEIDYLFLKEMLRDYVSPRAKITALLKAGVLIRVKKGLYVFGNAWAQKPYVKETLANLIYGPSYISVEYALSFYGFIPERVEAVTSVTNKKDKLFTTPLGVFTYRYLHPKKYPVGVALVMIDQTHPVLIATPEKALADKMALASPGLVLANVNELTDYLFADLRIPQEKIFSLNKKRLNQVARIYGDRNVNLLRDYLQSFRIRLLSKPLSFT